MAAILAGATGIATAMIWLGASSSVSNPVPALDSLTAVEAAHNVPELAADGIRARPKCPGCGVIVSMREVDLQDEAPSQAAAGGVSADNSKESQLTPARNHEITIRMADGSSRVINHASPASWRPGERVVIIGSASPSDR
jgi:hypothetical protein